MSGILTGAGISSIGRFCEDTWSGRLLSRHVTAGGRVSPERGAPLRSGDSSIGRISEKEQGADGSDPGGSRGGHPERLALLGNETLFRPASLGGREEPGLDRAHDHRGHLGAVDLAPGRSSVPPSPSDEPSRMPACTTQDTAGAAHPATSPPLEKPSSAVTSTGLTPLSATETSSTSPPYSGWGVTATFCPTLGFERFTETIPSPPGESISEGQVVSPL